jgi:hypothetical protein
MTPKEKAKELVEKFEPYCYHERIYCALVAVDEIIDVLNREDFSRNAIVFWASVKTEIEKL